MERIKQYYRLCAIKSNDDKPTPLYNQISENVTNVIIGKKYVTMFLKKDKKGYIIKETIIGGKRKNYNSMITNDQNNYIIVI